MALQTYSILYLNLICEMIYVVAERLKTQKIQIDKSKLGTYYNICYQLLQIIDIFIKKLNHLHKYIKFTQIL